MSEANSQRTDGVVVHIPGNVAYVDVLRSAAGLVARKMGFSYDGVEDISVVVDEASVLLLESAPTMPSLSLSIVETTDEQGDGVLELKVLAGSPVPGWSVSRFQTDLGWQLLSSLAAEVAVLDTPDRPGFRIRQPVR